VGVVPTADGRGYWVVTRQGAVYRFGDAGPVAPLRPAAPLIGALAL